MTLLQLHYINEICRCGSINKAAQNLFVSQSSLSSSIRELEDELGIRIFKRSNRGISITDDGAQFIRHIEPILTQHNLIKEIYSDKINTALPKLSVCAQRYPFCAKAFVQFLDAQYADRFRFSLKEMNMYQVIEDVSNQISDIGIISITDSRRKFMKKIFAVHNVEYTELTKTSTRVFLNQGHPLLTGRPITTTDLLDYPYVIFENNESSSINFSEEAILPETFQFDKVIYINDRATAYNILRHTNAFSTGSGILPEGFSDSNIISVPLDGYNDNISIGYIKYINEEFSANEESFIKILKSVLEEHV